MSTTLYPFDWPDQSGTSSSRSADGTSEWVFDPTSDAETASHPLFHTIEAVARTLGVSTKTVRRRIEEGVIHKVAMGGRLVRISSAELQRLAAGAPFGPRVQSDEVSITYQVLGIE